MANRLGAPPVMARGGGWRPAPWAPADMAGAWSNNKRCSSPGGHDGSRLDAAGSRDEESSNTCSSFSTRCFSYGFSCSRSTALLRLTCVSEGGWKLWRYGVTGGGSRYPRWSVPCVRQSRNDGTLGGGAQYRATVDGVHSVRGFLALRASSSAITCPRKLSILLVLPCAEYPGRTGCALLEQR